MSRTATRERSTKETSITIALDVDGGGANVDVSTGLPFFDNMLSQIGKHGGMDLTVKATGDLEVDSHHTVEDVAIVLGEAVRQALGDKKGIRRFGDAMIPMDEALAQAVVDVSGRPYCVHSGEPEGQEYIRIGEVPYTGSLTSHVLETLALHAHLCLHVTLLAGRDPHHIVECQFKAALTAVLDELDELEERR